MIARTRDGTDLAPFDGGQNAQRFFRIVFWLMRPNGRRTLKDLYRSSRLSEPTMRTALKRLVDQGFVSLSEDTCDQRQTFAQATPKLLEALDSYRALFTRAMAATDQSSETATPLAQNRMGQATLA